MDAVEDEVVVRLQRRRYQPPKKALRGRAKPRLSEVLQEDIISRKYYEGKTQQDSGLWKHGIKGDIDTGIQGRNKAQSVRESYYLLFLFVEVFLLVSLVLLLALWIL